jgi:molybdopterin converting factor small subunit
MSRMGSLTVRYFAGARAAAGVECESLAIPPGGLTVDDALRALADRHGPALERVLGACSFLLDEVAVRSFEARLSDESVLDVLPPFAGG